MAFILETNKKCMIRNAYSQQHGTHLVDENKKYRCIHSFPLKTSRRYLINNKFNYNFQIFIQFCCFILKYVRLFLPPVHYGKIWSAESASQPVIVHLFTGSHAWLGNSIEVISYIFRDFSETRQKSFPIFPIFFAILSR